MHGCQPGSPVPGRTLALCTRVCLLLLFSRYLKSSATHRHQIGSSNQFASSKCSEIVSKSNQSEFFVLYQMFLTTMKRKLHSRKSRFYKIAIVIGNFRHQFYLAEYLQSWKRDRSGSCVDSRVVVFSIVSYPSDAARRNPMEVREREAISRRALCFADDLIVFAANHSWFSCRDVLMELRMLTLLIPIKVHINQRRAGVFTLCSLLAV